MANVEQASDGTWRVRDGDEIIAEGLSNARAWQIAEIYSETDLRMNDTHRRISYHIGQW